MDVTRFWTWMLSFLQCTRPWTSLGVGHGCSLFSNALDHGRHYVLDMDALFSKDLDEHDDRN